MLVVVAIVVAVNYLSARQNKRWDLTENQQNSLSDQTVKLLKGLDAPVKFTVFDKQTGFERFRSSLDEYGYQLRRGVDVEYIDPDKRPVVAKQYQVTDLRHGRARLQGPRERVELVTRNRT